MEIELCWAYNRWLTEKALPEADGRFYSMLCLPFSDPDEALRQVETFGDRKHVTGFMITSVRTLPVHHNAYMKVYRAIEERGLALCFHSAINIGEPVFKSLNRFASVHALGFPFYNMLAYDQLGHQRARRALPQAAGDLDRGRARLDAVPDAAARPRIHAAHIGISAAEEEAERLHARHVLRVAADGTGRRHGALECTFRMINAETQLLYASDYPHWDFDLPSTIWDLPFLSEKAKHNILGGTAARLFKLPPRNEKQRGNLERFGNFVA